MKQTELQNEYQRQMEINAQRLRGIKSLFVDSELKDNNIAALNILNGGGNLSEVLFGAGKLK